MEPAAGRLTLTWVDGDYRRYTVMSLPWDDSLGRFLRALLTNCPTGTSTDRHIDEPIPTFERFRRLTPGWITHRRRSRQRQGRVGPAQTVVQLANLVRLGIDAVAA